jgi:hypothetical protein
MTKEVSFIPGFYTNRNSTSVYKIIIEPKQRNVSIQGSCNPDKDIPMRELYDTASKAIANSIVNQLVYTSYTDHSGYAPIKRHQFSVKDFTISEREVSKQIITGLTTDLNNLQARYTKLHNSYTELSGVYKYNSRSIMTKLIDWILYDKPFNKFIRSNHGM